MVVQPIGRSTRGNIYDPNLPALAEGEVAVWTQNGQLVRSRQSANGFLLNPLDGDGRIRVENGFLQAFSDSTIVMGALGYTRIQASDPALSETDPSIIVSPDTGVEVRALAGALQNFTVYADGVERLRITESQGIRLFGPGATGTERGIGLSTGSDYADLFRDLGLIDGTSVWPSGGAAGITNPTGFSIQIGDSTYTVVQAAIGTSTQFTAGGFAGLATLSINTSAASALITGQTLQLGTTSAGSVRIGVSNSTISFYGGGVGVVRANLVAARAALPATMSAGYVQAEVQALRNLAAAIADAGGNASGVNLWQTV